MPHQQQVWDVGLEVDDDGKLIYDAVDLTIMRQSGKTTSVFAKKVWRLTVAPALKRPDGKRWGRQRALYTAQRGKDARRKLEEEFAVLLKDAPKSFRRIENPKARPVRPHEWRLSLNNGAELLQFGRSNYLHIEPPTADVGHSDSLDDVTLDEIWAYQDDSVEQGVVPTMATRWNAQLWRTSTAGNEKSYYMWPIIKAGRAAACTCGAKLADNCTCGWTPGRRTAYFEWSLPEDCDIDDESLWWEHMPALGRTISVEFIRSRLEKAREKPEDGGEDLWRRGFGNIWVRTPLVGGETRLAKLPAEEWSDCRIGFDEVPVMNPGEVTIGFDVATAGEVSSVVIGAGTLDQPYVELVEHEPQTGWLPARLAQLALVWRPRHIGFDQQGPAGALVDVIRKEFRARGVDVELLHPMGSAEYKAACGAFHLDVLEGRLTRATDQPPLDAAGDDATERRVGDAWVWDRRTATIPISPLVAATVARALLGEPEESEANLW